MLPKEEWIQPSLDPDKTNSAWQSNKQRIMQLDYKWEREAASEKELSKSERDFPRSEWEKLRASRSEQNFEQARIPTKAQSTDRCVLPDVIYVIII